MRRHEFLAMNGKLAWGKEPRPRFVKVLKNFFVLGEKNEVSENHFFRVINSNGGGRVIFIK